MLLKYIKYLNRGGKICGNILKPDPCGQTDAIKSTPKAT